MGLNTGIGAFDEHIQSILPDKRCLLLVPRNMYFSLVLCLFALAMVHANVDSNQQPIQHGENQRNGEAENMKMVDNKERLKKSTTHGTLMPSNAGVLQSHPSYMAQSIAYGQQAEHHNSPQATPCIQTPSNGMVPSFQHFSQYSMPPGQEMPSYHQAQLYAPQYNPKNQMLPQSNPSYQHHVDNCGQHSAFQPIQPIQPMMYY